MRTIILTLLLLITLTACAGKEDVPTDPAAEGATTEEQAATETDDEAAAQADATEASPADDNQSIISDDIQFDPVGEVRMANGQTLELSKFEKIGKYFMYISGKLNGRSSTVISFTRLDDIKHWKGISFADPHNFTILNGQDQELRFVDSRIYIGSDSSETFTFHTLDSSGFSTKLTTVNKRDVKLITFIQAKEEE